MQSSDALGPQLTLRTGHRTGQRAAGTNVLRFTDLCCGLFRPAPPGALTRCTAIVGLFGARTGLQPLSPPASKQPGQFINTHRLFEIYLRPIQSTNCTDCGAARRVL